MNRDRVKISPQDIDLLESRAWFVERDKRTEYVVAYARNGKRRQKLRLHRLIVGAKPGQLVDHINGNGLDNRRENLRLCSFAENARNRQRKANTISRYKGVSLHPSPPHGRPWQAQICFNRKAIHIGFFANEKLAARAYDAAAQKHFGEFARLNFPVAP